MTTVPEESDGRSVEFLESFADLHDPRQQAKVLYPLEEILLLCLCGVLSGANSWVEIATYGQQRLTFLRRFLAFKNGTPSHDQLGDVFAVLDAKQFQSRFIAWVERLTATLREVVAVDGKTLRRSFDHAAGQGPIHLISAWSSGQRMVLGQCKVAKKSNEITAIPKLLELLTLRGAVVTIDAMGCQRAIAAQITDQEADYVLGLKGNQGTLHEDVGAAGLGPRPAPGAPLRRQVPRHRRADPPHRRRVQPRHPQPHRLRDSRRLTAATVRRDTPVSRRRGARCEAAPVMPRAWRTSNATAPAFFSWLGTTYYLTRDAVRDTLDRIAAVAAPGTRVALDYKYPRHLVPADGLLFADKLDQFVAKRGEPMLSMFTPDELNAELCRAGFTEIDHVSPEQQAQRYLEDRGDMTAPAPNFALALFAA